MDGILNKQRLTSGTNKLNFHLIAPSDFICYFISKNSMKKHFRNEKKEYEKSMKEIYVIKKN